MVEKMIVAGNYVTVHMRFTGHFTGRFTQVQGRGQPIPFIATDLVRIENGRVTDDWHIEANLSPCCKWVSPTSRDERSQVCNEGRA